MNSQQETRDICKAELLRMKYGFGGMKWGRFVQRISGNEFKLDSVKSKSVDLFETVNQLTNTQSDFKQ